MVKVYMLIGFPASTKSTYCSKLLEENPGAIVISRDKVGGTLQDLLMPFEQAITSGSGKDIILDNTHLTRESRKAFIDMAAVHKCEVEAMYIKSDIENCQIRCLRRMYRKFGDIFMTGKSDIKDPHIFPPAVLFAARKNIEEPRKDEGFSKITVIDAGEITWDPTVYKRRALFLDIDGTIRATEHLPNKYPTSVDEVTLLHDVSKMREKLDKYRALGYKLIGISNQSGIAKGILTAETADKIFARTRELLGYSEKEFPIMYCPHRSAPISCYCRKPQSGLGVLAAEKWNLQLSRCVMVGDMKTDETFATRLGIKFIDSDVFWSY